MPDEARLFREACLIDGHWIDSADAWIDVDNSATGEAIGRVPKLGPSRRRR